MTGKEIAKEVRKTKGKIFAMVNIKDAGLSVCVDKKDLASQLERKGDAETGLILEPSEHVPGWTWLVME